MPTRNCEPTPEFLSVLGDLSAPLGRSPRLERLVDAITALVPAQSLTLLRLEGEELLPLVVRGLPQDVLGRRFLVTQHPRLARILGSAVPVRFEADDPLPDPFDAWLSSPEHGRVHSCMGVAVRLGREVVGALTFDASEPGRFDGVDLTMLNTFAALAAASLRVAELVERLEDHIARREAVNQTLVGDALAGHGGVLIGDSPAMTHLRAELALVAQTDLPVLVTGESGVGKELITRVLHAQSRRAARPLVAVNCAALPQGLAESELFGHVRGAFTGAVADRPGRFELADGGTLFLDEVGELPLSLQPLLLRAVQFGEIQRIGSRREGRVDVRIIAATNRDLSVEVQRGNFREDLYHRLSVYPLRVPPLRERPADVAPLAQHFLARSLSRLGLRRASLTPEALSVLEAQPWPGNARELEHLVTRAALRASAGGTGEARITPGHLAEQGAILGAAAGVGTLSQRIDAFERRLVTEALEQHAWRWAPAARALGLDRANLHRLARRLGIERPQV